MSWTDIVPNLMRTDMLHLLVAGSEAGYVMSLRALQRYNHAHFMVAYRKQFPEEDKLFTAWETGNFGDGEDEVVERHEAGETDGDDAGDEAVLGALRADDKASSVVAAEGDVVKCECG